MGTGANHRKLLLRRLLGWNKIGDAIRKLLLRRLLGWNKIGDAIRMLLIEYDNGVEAFSEIVWFQVLPLSEVMYIKKTWNRDTERIKYEGKDIKILGEGCVLFKHGN